MDKEREPSRLRPLICVVDDDRAVREALQFSLRTEGFCVRTYADEKALFAEHDLPRCACLVVDQRLGDTSGLELIINLRRRGLSAPAILITTHPPAALRRRAALAEVPIIEKPLFGTALLDGIQHAVALGESSRRTQS